jgi:outer membrane immunogenic protein
MRRSMCSLIALLTLASTPAFATDDRADVAPLLKSSAKNGFKILEEGEIDAAAPTRGKTSLARQRRQEGRLTSSLKSDAAASAEEAPGYVPLNSPPLPWSGVYIGLNGGGLFGAQRPVGTGTLGAYNDPGLESGAVFATSAASVVPSGGATGFIGGVQLGYNQQFGDVVLGFEADFQGTTAYGSGNAFGSGFDPVSGARPLTLTTTQKSLPGLGTLRARVGYLATPEFLLYGTAGFAYGETNFNVAITSADTAGIYKPAYNVTSFSSIRDGWAAGGGLEWMFWPHWSAKLDYLYYDLGATNLIWAGIANPAPGFATGWGYLAGSTSRFNGHVIRAGLNYHLGWGTPALPDPLR